MNSALIFSLAFLLPLLASANPKGVEKAKAAQVFCAPGFACDPGVGMLSIVERTDLGQCTGVLIAPNIVATNAHCVPPDLRKSGSSCADRIFLNFVPTPGFETQLGCDRVLVAKGADRRGVPDLAILRLSSASRRPVHPVSRQGFPAGELFRMEKVTPVDGVPGIVGRQEENRDCSAMSDSFFAPLFTHAGSPVVSLTGCPTVNGNSGSPIFGADGTLRGLHFAADDADDEWFRAKHLNVKGKRPLEINYNDNFSCLSLPAEAGAGDAGASCRSAPLENAAYRAVRQAGGVVGLSFNDFESYEPVRDAHGRELRISVDEVGRILRIR